MRFSTFRPTTARFWQISAYTTNRCPYCEKVFRTCTFFAPLQRYASLHFDNLFVYFGKNIKKHNAKHIRYFQTADISNFIAKFAL